MKLNEFAKTILYGQSFEDKCLSPDLVDFTPGLKISLDQAPQLPGRPRELAKSGKASFPALARLHEAQTRGEVLHFFANHELLAIELMALVILRFPDAPESFLKSIVSTIGEEQNHLRLYVQRMGELGIRFGDLPVSNYFWNCMRQMKSPVDFVVQMSLTFEQANLDYALFYKNAVERVEDFQTAAILERVFLEEIGHVKNGLFWFNRLREEPKKESDWEAYLRLLPPPLNPSRAKGLEYSEEARRKAGLSEQFIRELQVYSGSKGRPPILWHYNPSCDSEIARGKPGYTPTAGALRFSQDLQHLPLFLALDKDLVLVDQKPRTEWIAQLQQAGFTTPEFVEAKGSSLSCRKGFPTSVPNNFQKNFKDAIRVQKIGGMEPWGWSPDSFERFRPLRSRIVRVSGGNGLWCGQLLDQENFQKTGLGRFFSKEWSVAFLRNWMTSHPNPPGGGSLGFLGKAEKASDSFGPLETIGATYSTWDASLQRVQELLAQGKSAMVKAPYGTAGQQVRRIQSLEELSGKHGGWIQNQIKSQGLVIIEEWLNKVYDLSIQIEVGEEGIRLLDVRRFLTGSQNEYRGTFLGKKLPGFAETDLRFIHRLISDWRPFVLDLGKCLKSEGYLGPAGVDGLIWRDSGGNLKLKPLVELNPRWTMGRVALELEKNLKPGATALWSFLSIRELKRHGFETAESFALSCSQKFPVQLAEVGGGVKRIESGVVFTNDPHCAQEVLTVLAVLPESVLVNPTCPWYLSHP